MNLQQNSYNQNLNKSAQPSFFKKPDNTVQVINKGPALDTTKANGMNNRTYFLDKNSEQLITKNSMPRSQNSTPNTTFQKKSSNLNDSNVITYEKPNPMDISNDNFNISHSNGYVTKSTARRFHTVNTSYDNSNMLMNSTDGNNIGKVSNYGNFGNRDDNLDPDLEEFVID